jgi:hypothetical protein
MNIISELLLSLLDIAIVSVDAFDPYKTYGLSTDDYRKWRKSHHIPYKASNRLISEGYIKNNKQGRYLLTPKAYKNISSVIEKSLSLSQNTKWDGVWRVVVFDIPEEKRSARNLFRTKLKDLGLEMIQKSVFCHPHDCMKEIIFLAKVYNLEKYITYMEVSSIVTGKNIFKIFESKGFLK